jgi:hypothetical protein
MSIRCVCCAEDLGDIHERSIRLCVECFKYAGMVQYRQYISICRIHGRVWHIHDAVPQATMANRRK